MKFKLLLLLLFSCYYSFGQTPKVFKLKSFETAVINAGDTKVNWEENVILVVIDLNNLKVNTYGEEKGDFDLVQIDKRYRDENDNDWLVYSAVDNNGKDCKVKLEVFQGHPEHVASLFIVYDGLEIVYRLKKD